MSTLIVFRHFVPVSGSTRSILRIRYNSKYFENSSWSLRKCSCSVKYQKKDEESPTFNSVDGTPNKHEMTGIDGIEMENNFVQERNRNVGITEYLMSPPQTRATIKRRSTEFQVNEIDMNGNIIHLTDIPSEIDLKKDKDNKSKFLHFTMYKQGLSTSEVFNLLSKEFSLKRNEIGITYAGRKDKKAVTAQRMCITNVPGTLNHLNEFSSRHSQFKFGNYSYSETPIQFGSLQGNHFKILLRNVQMVRPGTNKLDLSSTDSLQEISDNVEKSIKSLIEYGYINYWGLQRFGFNSEQVGAALLRMDFDKLFDLMLAPQPQDEDLLLKLKDIWYKRRDPNEMLELIKENSHYFSRFAKPLVQLTKGLVRHYSEGSSDLIKAYQRIPWDTRSVYGSTFVNYLWNHVATFRIKHFGFQVLPGDFVNCSLEESDIPTEGQSSITIKSDEFKYKYRERWKQVKMLTKKDVAQGKYSIYDVLLPVLGIKMSTYPHPQIQKYCDKLFIKHQLTSTCISSFKYRNEVEKGFFRPLLVKPDDVKYKIILYSPSQKLTPLMPSDWDILRDRLKIDKGCDQMDQSNGDQIQESNSIEPDETESSDSLKKVGVIIEFSLPASSYATMALRQVIF